MKHHDKKIKSCKCKMPVMYIKKKKLSFSYSLYKWKKPDQSITGMCIAQLIIPKSNVPKIVITLMFLN